MAFLSLRSATGALTGKDHGLAPLIEALSALLEKVLERKSGEEARLEGILSGIAEGVYVIDGAGKLCSVNPRGAELITGFCPNGLECVKKGRAGLRPHQRDGCPLAAVIASLKGLHAGRGTTHSEEIRNNEGNVLHLSAREIDGGYVVTTRDATEESFLRERAYHSGRLSTIGEMTAGIAHEINNPLQMVMANVELLAEAAAGDGFASRKLGNIKDGILRIRGIVANLLLFARGETVKTEDADINTLVANCVDLARHHVKLAGVGIITDLGPGPLTVRCNPNLFQQVILNLLQNSRDAIEGSRKGSKVIVRTRPLEGSVVMEVSDDGPGIPDDITGRIFAPFFTTKDPGKGTGLGLAISKRFIEETGGSISASNGPAGGAVFRVTLPFSGVKNKGAKGLNGASEDAPHDKALPSKGAEVPLEEGECSDCKCAHREEERVEGAVIPLRPGEDKPGICCKTGKPHARKKAR